MAAKTTKSVRQSPRSYYGAKIPMRLIRRYARQVADRFKPDQIILFGSYAYGTPHEESDVDLMVVMPARNIIDLALRIDLAFDAPFSVDLHVRTPKQIARGLKEGDCDWFPREVMEKGRVLYEAPAGARGKRHPAENTREKIQGAIQCFASNFA